MVDEIRLMQIGSQIFAQGLLVFLGKFLIVGNFCDNLIFYFRRQYFATLILEYLPKPSHLIFLKFFFKSRKTRIVGVSKISYNKLR